MKFNDKVTVRTIDFQDGNTTLLAMKKDISKLGQEAFMLWQDPTFIGFVKVLDNALQIQPDGPDQLEFELLRDFRLFGEKGEWHIWKSNNERFFGRLRSSQIEKGMNYLDEEHFLWGTDLCEDNAVYTEWSCVKEDRGMRLWLPWKQSNGFPSTLKIRQFINQNEATGLAGIVDAMILMKS